MKWWKWNSWLFLFVHLTPSIDILSLKSKSSFKVAGLWSFGFCCIWQTEHRMSGIAWTSFSSCCRCFMTWLNVCAEGWPRFLCNFMSVRRSSMGSARNFGPWALLCTSISVIDSGLEFGSVATSGLHGTGCLFSDGSSGTWDWVRAVGSGVWFGVCKVSATGLRAKTVILRNDGWERLHCCRYDRFSHSSQVSSIMMFLVFLCVIIALRYGASPIDMFLGGGIVLSVPLQAMARTTSLSWKRVVNCWRTVGSSTSLLPTRGWFRSTWSHMALHIELGVCSSPFPFPVIRRRFVWMAFVQVRSNCSPSALLVCSADHLWELLSVLFWPRKPCQVHVHEIPELWWEPLQCLEPFFGGNFLTLLFCEFGLLCSVHFPPMADADVDDCIFYHGDSHIVFWKWLQFPCPFCTRADFRGPEVVPHYTCQTLQRRPVVRFHSKGGFWTWLIYLVAPSASDVRCQADVCTEPILVQDVPNSEVSADRFDQTSWYFWIHSVCSMLTKVHMLGCTICYGVFLWWFPWKEPAVVP